MNKALGVLVEPFSVIKFHKTDFTIWFVFTVFAGQLGIIINIIIRSYSYNTGLFYSIYLDSISGNFYTFVIATVASMLGPLFINFVESERLKFKTLKILALILTIFLLFFTGVIYSATQSKNTTGTHQISLEVDKTQLFLYFISILVCVYIYSIIKLDYHQQEFSHLAFNEKDDKNVDLVVEKSKSIIIDGNGNRL